jgi:glycosyltransferase involved in cell wall biosynthesis
MNNNEKISVVLCTLNEEKRIKACLDGIKSNSPFEIIVVDGGSNDKTIEIAREYTNKIFSSNNSNLTKDRQIGIDNCQNELVAMIDSDHILKPGDLSNLIDDLYNYNLDIVQSGLEAYELNGFWVKAENEAWMLTHNKPFGIRQMIGTAPAIYKKRIFEHIQFSDEITKTIDDTDFMFRLSKLNKFRIGVGKTKIKQLHYSSFNSYLKKFYWYGKGDGEFCLKHKNRTYSMFYHLLIRYTIIFPLKALKHNYLYAAPFFVLQGITRATGAFLTFFKFYKS